MMQIHNLSSDWNLCKNEEEIILKNTYLNSQAIELPSKEEPRLNKKRITWGEKVVIANKPNPMTHTGMMSTTMTRFKDSRDKKNEHKRLKSILKGEDNSDQE